MFAVNGVRVVAGQSAISAYRKAMKLDPTHETGKDELKRLGAKP